MKAFKGFNKDMTCRDFQYEIGKTYETDEAKMCKSGFHACENPLDCFRYYSPATSKYCEVELDDNGERNNEDTKVVGKKITIGGELSVPMLCKLHFEYVTSKCNPANSRVAGDNESASAGYRGSAVSRGISAVGKNGVAVARGNDVKVKGGIGSLLVLCEENDNDYDIKDYKIAVVDAPTHWNMTEQDYIDMCVKKAKEDAKSVLANYCYDFDVALNRVRYGKDAEMTTEEYEKFIKDCNTEVKK